MKTAKDKLVYDCNVYLQYLINNNGAGGRCVELALSGEIELFVSDPILAELRELPEKEVCRLRGIDPPKIERLIKALLQSAILIENVANVFVHPIDADDSCYVNLAIAVGADLIISRDRHLLNLVKPTSPWSAEFRERFSQLRIMRPDEFLKEYDARFP